MKKMEAYQWLQNKSRDLGWIANVFLTSSGKFAAKNIQSLVRLVQQGIDVGSISFTMPYDALSVDGQRMTPEAMREYTKRND